MPDVIFYDNNCGLQEHVRKNAEDSQFFRQSIMAVDVFHFKSKHKTSDIVCQTHCNPANFPDLMTGEKWTFNSSAAEQANVWFGKYESIVREMHQHRYNFFLDEMISLHNDELWASLTNKGLKPHLVPLVDLQNPVYI